MKHTSDYEPIYCENCCTILEMGIPITVDFGYGHYLDEVTVSFCSDKCLISYLRKEQNKLKKDNRFIYGKERKTNEK